MTREEAIDILKHDISADKQGIVYCHDELGIEALEMAIKALEQESSEDMTIAYLMGYYADKEPCDDAISRQAVYEVLDSMLDDSSDNKRNQLVSLDSIADEIAELPSVKQEPKTGHWIKSRDSYGNNHFTCPFCKHDIATKYAGTWKDNYCSNCGVRMVEQKERSDKE